MTTGFVISMLSVLDLPVVKATNVLSCCPCLITSRKILNVTLQIIGNFFLVMSKVNSNLFQLDHLVCLIICRSIEAII